MAPRPPDPFTAFCMELLAPLGAVRARRMFGGQALYVDGLCMALILQHQLYLKTDAATRERFAAAGCEPFSYATKAGKRTITSYCRAPEAALESPPLMQRWARLALEAALRAANARAARSRPAKPPVKAPTKTSTKASTKAPAKSPARKAPAAKPTGRR